jgi:murein DD-endopeptidase MepM/ murein hydrolase activator NlpD
VHENALLESELDDLRSTLDTLRTSLEVLSTKDEQYRLLAGLDPVDADVRRVGIGGPGTAMLESHPLFSTDARLARMSFCVSTELNEMIRRARLLSFSWREASDTLTQKYTRLASTPSIQPVDGYVSSSFSHERWHPILGRPRPHLGLDIVAPEGTPIVAAANGRVRFVGRLGEYGLAIEVDHGNGIVTRYAHTSSVVVRRGQPVKRGDMVGRVGQSGLAVGPHLHYEVLINGSAANPRKYILDGSVVHD